MTAGTGHDAASSTQRPCPGDLPPAGYHFEAYFPDEWVMPPIGAGRCRASAGKGQRVCGKPAVATLMRTRWRRSGDSSPVPWDYCEEHLYSGWVEDGQVVRWRLVKDEQ